MPGFHIEHAMLKYLINYRCGCGKRSNKHFMRLAGAEAIAARAQPLAKAATLFS